jgi:dynein heavy chain
VTFEFVKHRYNQVYVFAKTYSTDLTFLWQLKMFLDEFDEIPWDALRYTCGETNYGGRVTDAHDRTTVNAMLRLVYTSEVFNENYRYSESGTYYAPPNGTIEDHRRFIRDLPLVEAPECFGLHENANITFATAETYSLFESLLGLMPRGGAGGGGGSGSDKILEALATDMLDRMPVQSEFFAHGLPFRVDDVRELYPTMYTESMNTVLTQELLRFNNVIVLIRSSLKQLRDAVRGVVVMSSELERTSISFLNGAIPAMWASKCYPSLKPLASFFDDFMRRLTFLQTWITEGTPVVYWISGFYFTQSFLTGTLQNFARKHRRAIDTLSWSFEVRREEPSALERPSDGSYVDGLFLDGAAWDLTDNVLAEQKPKVLFVPMRVIWLKPCPTEDLSVGPTDYLCPIYKTSARRGTLSTTGHSTNFVMDIVLPSPRPSAHWILRGVACLTQLDF